ncbi:MAG: NAD-dependent deacylase [Chloroflexi bacterium]|nr:NAD-dependent deacylase [Chloroflexota bacterium]
MTSTSPVIQLMASLLWQAKYGVIFSGAGISTRSGIPDFRSPDSGLWAKYDPREVASIGGFVRHPEAFYEWIRPLARTIWDAQPNGAHQATAWLQQQGHIKHIITQNIDGLHQKAGAKGVTEVHGTLYSMTCVLCGRVYQTADYLDELILKGDIPRCPVDQGMLKPNTILFGEQLPYRAIGEARSSAQKADLMLILGTSLEVAPVSELPRYALANNAKLIIINYDKTYLDDQATLVINGDVSEILPQVVAAMQTGKG